MTSIKDSISTLNEAFNNKDLTFNIYYPSIGNAPSTKFPTSPSDLKIGLEKIASIFTFPGEIVVNDFTERYAISLALDEMYESAYKFFKAITNDGLVPLVNNVKEHNLEPMMGKKNHLGFEGFFMYALTLEKLDYKDSAIKIYKQIADVPFSVGGAIRFGDICEDVGDKLVNTHNLTEYEEFYKKAKEYSY